MMHLNSQQAALTVLALFLVCSGTEAGTGQDTAVPGLIGHYRSAAPCGESTIARIDAAVAFDWSDGSPDASLPCGNYSVAWEGLVRIQYAGTYRFAVQGNGEASVFLQERQVFPVPEGKSEPAVPLDAGDHAIRVCYDAPAREARVHVIWSSDTFPAEVVNARYLFHHANSEKPVARQLAWQRGRVIVQRYGCGRCHPIPGIDRTIRPGLAMPHVLEMKPKWVAAWLRDPQAVRPGTRMGSPGGTPQQMEELISNLLALVEQPEVRGRIDAKWHCDGEVDPLDDADSARELVQEGRRRFYELGCSACHAPETPEKIDPTRGPSLADIGAKWPKAYLRRLILDPVGRYPSGGNPAYELAAPDVDRLVAYLSTFRISKGDGKGTGLSSVPAKTVLKLQSGQSLLDPSVLPEVKAPFLGRSCHACHSPEGAIVDGPVLTAKKCESQTGCLRSDRAASWAPQYHLPAPDRAAVVEFLSHPVKEPSQVASGELARRTIEERLSCFACHQRNGAGGEQLAVTLPVYLNTNAKAGSGSIAPPDLSGVGARLLRPWMLHALDGKAGSNRPWLTVKMPRFGLSEAERTAIAERLAVEDQIPGLDQVAAGCPFNDLPAVGPELMSERGFNCVSCHFFGEDNYVPGRPGPNLSMAAERIGRNWFHRWVPQPCRIQPATPMPNFDKAAGTIGGLDAVGQREVIWRHLVQRAEESRAASR